MAVLLLRLAGPMQSWGTQSRFGERDTGREPSRSGVTGLLCAALGRVRTEPLDDFAALEMAVRVDREGEVARDFHTAGGGRLSTRPTTRAGRLYGVAKASDKPTTGLTEKNEAARTVISNRDYLADADFLVALTGERAFLAELSAALACPRWPLSLGRKAFIPGEPVRIVDDRLDADGLLDSGCVQEALEHFPWRAPVGWRPQEPDWFDAFKQRRAVSRLRLVLETDEPDKADGHPFDLPLSFEPRRFAGRLTRTVFLEEGQLKEIAVPPDTESTGQP